MIALAVILSAVISQFVLQLQGILVQPIQGGVTINEEPSDGSYEVSITWTTSGTVNELYAVTPDNAKTPRIQDVGETITVSDVEQGEKVKVLGVMPSGREGVIQIYTVGR